MRRRWCNHSSCGPWVFTSLVVLTHSIRGVRRSRLFFPRYNNFLFSFCFLAFLFSFPHLQGRSLGMQCRTHTKQLQNTRNRRSLLMAGANLASPPTMQGKKIERKRVKIIINLIISIFSVSYLRCLFSDSRCTGNPRHAGSMVAAQPTTGADALPRVKQRQQRCVCHYVFI